MRKVAESLELRLLATHIQRNVCAGAEFLYVCRGGTMGEWVCTAQAVKKSFSKISGLRMCCSLRAMFYTGEHMELILCCCRASIRMQKGRNG